MKLLGLDPGLRATGWGVVSFDGDHLRHVSNGTIRVKPDAPLAERLHELFCNLVAVVKEQVPDSVAVEETFVNKNPQSTLKLGQARGVALLAPATLGVSVSEYAANLVKKTVVGVGHADKNQVQVMVAHLLPGVNICSADSADALAIAICHGHHLPLANRWQQKMADAIR
ncbi:crossover junction endodeoxyribonuclease RuvC [bacterium]|nr:crossover junction endodeoxyribonuclease RuvC [bacterium]